MPLTEIVLSLLLEINEGAIKNCELLKVYWESNSLTAAIYKCDKEYIKTYTRIGQVYPLFYFHSYNPVTDLADMTWIDPSEDGWNGNEKPYFIRSKDWLA